ncbi:MAG: extracellular solute-binding protein [Synechococcales bacterium]|nr:extracellular solute-binding protein [Synechococcales bacterium]
MTHQDPSKANSLGRRSLLIGIGGLILGSLLSQCQPGIAVGLTVQFLESSLPPILLREFERNLNSQIRVNLSPQEQLADLFALLNEPSPSNPAPPSLQTLGDYWLTTAIQQQLIAPLPIANLDGWQQLPESWRRFVQRDEAGRLDPDGPIWAAPYRWSNLAIAYRTEKFEDLDWRPTDWSDLWRPEVTRQISLLDSARIAIGIALKTLGQGFNTPDLRQVEKLPETLAALQQQVKFYSSTNYLQPFILGDTWVAVGWSNELVPLMQRDRRIAALVPPSGTALTADLWVRPHPQGADSPQANASTDPPGGNQNRPRRPLPTAPLPDLMQRWIEFFWQDEVVTQLSLLSNAASPLILPRDRQTLPETLRTDAIRLPDPETLENSEFLLPLTAATARQYRDLWLQTRRA